MVVRRDLEQDVNFQYLKHVVLKFMLSRESEVSAGSGWLCGGGRWVCWGSYFSLPCLYLNRFSPTVAAPLNVLAK